MLLVASVSWDDGAQWPFESIDAVGIPALNIFTGEVLSLFANRVACGDAVQAGENRAPVVGSLREGLAGRLPTSRPGTGYFSSSRVVATSGTSSVARHYGVAHYLIAVLAAIVDGAICVAVSHDMVSARKKCVRLRALPRQPNISGGVRPCVNGFRTLIRVRFSRFVVAPAAVADADNAKTRLGGFSTEPSMWTSASSTASRP